MKIDQKQLLEAVGVSAVVASLIFVGMQLLLDRRVAEAAQYQSRAESRMENIRAQFSNMDYVRANSKLWEAGLKPGWWDSSIDEQFEFLSSSSGITMDDFFLFYLRGQFSVILQDNNYYQYEQGLLDEEAWLGLRSALKDSLRNPQLRHSYLGISTLRSSTRQLMEQIVEEIESEENIVR